jgi:hypothetical protein
LRKERENVKKQMPKPVNLNDCVLLHQMGYRVEINDGKVTAVVKEGKRRGKNIARNYETTGQYRRHQERRHGTDHPQRTRWQG